ncbi:MAG: hypothetical protein ACUVXA_17990 [Candidatus Jordarchaeum sp.]|uniref:hypothetical protein n=1 Tax=Candidatus Jordarchaeum sp. TaxID=2823881 RepID=UPI0040499537
MNKKVGRGNRSAFVKEAIIEKLRQKPESKATSLENEVHQLRSRVVKLERIIKKEEAINDIEMEKENLRQFLNQSCHDQTDKLIINHLLEHEGATTKDLESVTGLKRRQILNRIKKIANRTEEKTGQKIIQFKRTKDKDIKQAWWINLNQLAK